MGMFTVYDENVYVEIMRNTYAMTVHFWELQKGDTISIGDHKGLIIKEDAHKSRDARYEGWLFLGADGDFYYPEDFGADVKRRKGDNSIMTPITQETASLLKKEISEALAAVGTKHGLTITVHYSGPYTSTEIKYKVKVTDVAANWNKCISGTGLHPTDLGQTVALNNGKLLLTIVGFDRNARTNKVQLVDQSGNQYAAPISEVIAALSEKDPSRKPAPIGNSPEALFDSKAFICGLRGKVTYGQTFQYGSETYKVIDLNITASRYPIIAESITSGKQYRFGLDALKDN